MSPPPAAATATASAAPRPPKRRVCFSFAAYAKAVIEHIRSSGVPVDAGLSDHEFTVIESDLKFEFPPDLRSILREGLPIGDGFPNWRSASPKQLQILLAVPASGLLHAVSNSGFWPAVWGRRPVTSGDRAAAAARAAIAKAPVLVPIYRHFYISAIPNLAGNPVFHIRGGDVRCGGFDLSDFFQRGELGAPAPALPWPAWAAKSARKIEVWSDLAEGGGSDGGPGLEGCLKEMRWRLREGGWGEEDVQEMLSGGTDGYNEERSRHLGERMVLKDQQSVQWHVRLLALALLRAGWSSEDVVEAMGCFGDTGRKVPPARRKVGPTSGDGEISLEF